MKFLYNQPALLLSLTAFFWAGNFVIGRAVANDIPPVALACMRWTFALLVFLPFAWPHVKRDAAILAKHWKIVVFLSVTGPASFNTLSYTGLVHTEALNGLLFNAAGPMFIAAAAFLIFGDRLGRRQIAGLAVGFAGILLVLTHGEIGQLAHVQFNPGDALIVIAVATWGVYTAYLRKRPAAIAWQSFSAATFAVAAIVNFPLALVEHNAGNTLAVNLPNLAVVAYVAIFPSLIGYIFYNRGVELVGAARAGAYLFLIPVFGAILATIFLGEKLYAFHIAAFALIIGGVTLATTEGQGQGPVSRPA